MFLEHNSNIVLEILDIIMLCKHNVPEAYFILTKVQKYHRIHIKIVAKFIFGLAKSYLVKNPKQIEKIVRFRKTFCKIIVRCGENVGEIGYKNSLQVSVGHLRVPGAGDENENL